MYLPSFTNLLQDRTSGWYRLSNDTERLKIGRLTTFERLFANRRPRKKIEGTFYGISTVEGPLTMLRVIKYIDFNYLNFIFGTLSIDYRNNRIDCTLYEAYEDGGGIGELETDSSLSSVYTFNYLYAVK